jgi:hypothetical protein
MAKKLVTSPKGTLVYPWLNGKPDTKFKEEGQWKTGLRLLATDPAAIKLMKEIDDRIDHAVAEAKKNADSPKKAKAVKPCDDKPYRMETDDDDNPTGNVIFNFKMKASGVNRKTKEEFTRKPALFDAKGEPLPSGVKIGGGSEAKVSFEFFEFPPAGKTGAGVSLRLAGVQIIKLVEWGAGDAEYFGFEDESEDEEEGPVETQGDGAEEAPDREPPEDEEETEF